MYIIWSILYISVLISKQTLNDSLLSKTADGVEKYQPTDDSVHFELREHILSLAGTLCLRKLEVGRYSYKQE